MDLPRVGRMSPAANTVLIAVNPSAGKGSRRHLTDQLASRLTEQDFQVRFVQELEELTEQSHRLQSEGQLRAVVAAGGDGTAATLVNRIPPAAPMAILPLGTENLLAKYLDQITSPEHLSKIINQGLVVHLDAGLAGNRIFLLMAGCGFDADVVRRMHHGRSGNITHFDYAKPLLASLRHYPFPRLRIDYETGNRSGAHEQKTIQARWAFIVNLPRYARGLKFAPRAVGTDGLLDVCTFQKGNWWHALRYLSGVLMGRHMNWPDCQIVRTRRLQVVADQQSSDGIPFQLDGDPGGVLPVDIRVLPGRLRLLVSERWAEEHGFPVNQESSTLSE